MKQMMDMHTFCYKPVLNALPENLQRMVCRMPMPVLKDLEEIRIREDRPLMVYSRGRDYFLCQDGRLNSDPGGAYITTRQDIQRLLQLISEYSIYALQEEMRSGYITIKGGYRIGLAGKAVVEDGKIKTLQHISSFNIRITRQIKGCANKAMPFVTEGGEVLHTLILSPPQMGKTTLVRDLVRQLSDGNQMLRGLKVGVVDERSEIAGCFQGIPQNDIGMRTDILDACPKAQGIMMLIRSMSPRIIVTDEIGRMEDVAALEEALNAGIRIITTAHGRDIEDARRRPILSKILEKKIFQRILVLGNSLGVGTLEKVYDGSNYKLLLNRPIR